jgi:speckle-type POZ protein
VPTYTHVSKWTHTFTPGGEHRGFPKFVKRKVLEQGSIFSCYLKDDRFSVRCDITVITESTVPPARPSVVVAAPPSSDSIFKKEAKKEEEGAPERFVIVPPPDMHRHLGHLLSSGDGADVTLEVEGETFMAHRSILTARSPVFKAELFSPTEGTSTTVSSVSIKAIEPRVFKALLHFIYTDSLPEIDDKGETMAMAPRLLVAADRYGLVRLKLICEDKLCKHICTASVGTILALAGKHDCDGLKRACLKFLMSGGNLKAAIATDGFDDLASSCPSVLKELLAKVVL